MVAKLLKMYVFHKDSVIHFIKEEWYDNDLIILFFEEVALEVAFHLVLLEDLILHVVMTVYQILDLYYALLVSHVVFVMTLVEFLLVLLIL